MIVRRRFDLPRLTRYVAPILAPLLLYDTVVTALFVVSGFKFLALNALPLSLMGAAIALVVTLRNNAAYARWWEARTLWGAVVNNSRNFARGLIALLDDPALRARLIRLQIAYASSLRSHLLRKESWDAGDYVPDDVAETLAAAHNVPTAIQTAIAVELQASRRRGELDTIAVATLSETLSDLANAQGGLERIRNTPLPRQYDQLPRAFILVYCLLLPLGLIHTLGVLTPLGSTVVGLMFLILDQTGRDLEKPLSGSIHDVPMKSIVRTIEIDLLQTTGARNAPAPVAEIRGVLW